MKLAVHGEGFASGEAQRRDDPPRAERENGRDWWLGGTDAGRRALTIAAVVVPALRGGWRDAAAAGCSHLVAHRVCSAMKHAGSEQRPDGSDDQSFPSSHAIETFSAATCLAFSGGRSLGLPAYAAAVWIAYGRLQANRHHPRDVVAGAIGGIASGWVATRTARAVAERATA